MTDKDVVFALTRSDVIECASEMDIPAEAITDDVLEGVVEGIEADGRWWQDVVKDAINFALKS